MIVQLHFSKLFLILKSGVNHTSRGSISTSTLPSIKLRKCSSKIITSILSFISGRLATKSNQIKQLIRNGRSASLQRTFKKSFTSFSHSTRNKTRDGLIRVRNIRALNGRFNTSITHAYSIVIGSKNITLNATGGGFLTASKQFRLRASIKMIGVSNLQSFIASMTQKLTLSDISDESKNYLDKAGITTACLRIKSKWTAGGK